MNRELSLVDFNEAVKDITRVSDREIVEMFIFIKKNDSPAHITSARASAIIKDKRGQIFRRADFPEL